MKFYQKKGTSLEETPILMTLGRRHTIMEGGTEHRTSDLSDRVASRANSVSSMEQISSQPSKHEVAVHRGVVGRRMSEDKESIFSAASTVIITESELSSSWIYKDRKAKANLAEKSPDTKSDKGTNGFKNLASEPLQDPSIKPVPLVAMTPKPEKCSSCCCYLAVVAIICLASVGILTAIGGIIYMELFTTYLEESSHKSAEISNNTTLEINITDFNTLHENEDGDHVSDGSSLKLPASKIAVTVTEVQNTENVLSEAVLKTRHGILFGLNFNETSRVNEKKNESISSDGNMVYEIPITLANVGNLSEQPSKRPSNDLGDSQEDFKNRQIPLTETSDSGMRDELEKSVELKNQLGNNMVRNIVFNESFDDSDSNLNSIDIKSTVNVEDFYEQTVLPDIQHLINGNGKKETSGGTNVVNVDISESNFGLGNDISSESEKEFGIPIESTTATTEPPLNLKISSIRDDKPNRKIFDILDSDDLLLNRPIIDAGSLEFLRHLGFEQKTDQPLLTAEDMDRKFSISEVLKYLRSLDVNSTLPTSRERSADPDNNGSIRKNQEDIGEERAMYLDNLRKKWYDST